MPAPTWTAGQVLAAADVNSWFVGQYAVKTSDQAVTSSIILVNDTQLSVALAANATYLLHGFLSYAAASTIPGITWGWTFPAGLISMTYGYTTVSGAATVYGNANQSGIFGGTTPSGDTAAAVTTLRSASLLGTVVNGSPAGTLQLQWAQNVSNAASTLMKAGSALALWRIS
jgi:hypothetical protein